MRLLLLLLVSTAAWSGPCVTAANCTEWVTFAGGPARSIVYRTYALDVPNLQITRALIVIHGAGRDADNYSARPSPQRSWAVRSKTLSSLHRASPRAQEPAATNWRPTRSAGVVAATVGAPEASHQQR
jgi:hypothetical protein